MASRFDKRPIDQQGGLHRVLVEHESRHPGRNKYTEGAMRWDSMQAMRNCYLSDRASELAR